MNKVRLTKKELRKILEIIDNIPDLDQFELVVNDSNGIGYTIDIEFSHELNGMLGKMTVEVVGVEDW